MHYYCPSIVPCAGPETPAAPVPNNILARDWPALGGELTFRDIQEERDLYVPDAEENSG